MEPVNTESIRVSSVMESEHGSITNSDDLFTSGKRLSSSSSPDSPLEDPFQEDDYESNTSTPSTTAQSSSECDEDNVSTTESPPTQVMEQPLNSPYRIPPSVFARTQSTAPVEWSTASNESLFSIHMGNMSFTNDNIFFRSGELGMPGEPSTSGQMFNFSAEQSSGSKPMVSGTSHELGVAFETMKEVLKENEENTSHKKLSIAGGNASHHSQGSATSTASFAFPILAGDFEKGCSTKIGGSAKVGPDKLQSQSRSWSRSRSRPQSQKHPIPEPEPKNPAANPSVAKTCWFSWLPACRFCC